jgi:replicative DNA helicase
MDNLDLDLLRFMQVKENYDKYHKVITKGMMTKESFTLLGDYGAYFKEYPNLSQIDEGFKLWFRVTAHPAWKDDDHKYYSTISDNVSGRSTPDISGSFGDQLDRLRFDALLREQQTAFAKGTASIEDVVSTLDDSTRRSGSVDEGNGTFSLDDLAQHQRGDEGLYWRCEDLNKAIGPIRKGDFVIIAKRPEVGGTSFLCSELAFMLEQLPNTGSAVLFNNEEAPDKVYTRMVSGAMGIDYRTMMTAPAHWQTQYDAWLDGREFKLSHDTTMNLNSIWKELESEEHDIIGINVLLKVGGTSAKEDHDKFQALGEECRRISQAYGPVIAIVQADPSAEGMRYIPQDRIYKSKTALQGEADVLIMIGMDDDGPVDSRYIHVAKNKIPPAPCCDLALKHIKGEVKFDLGTGRFESLNFKGNSRCTK